MSLLVHMVAGFVSGKYAVCITMHCVVYIAVRSIRLIRYYTSHRMDLPRSLGKVGNSYRFSNNQTLRLPNLGHQTNMQPPSTLIAAS